MKPLSIPSRTFLVIAFILLLYAAAGYVLKPTQRLSEARGVPALEELVPKSFNGWVLDPRASVVTVSPDVLETLSTIYTNTLSRTYMNAKGERVMLSIAYGADQSRTMQVHRPEVCYTAQGFNVKGMQKATLTYGGRQLPVMHVHAVKASEHREEPITYWVAIGDYLVRGNVEQGLARLKYASKGVIPDGTLIRVSTLGSDTKLAYAQQAQFINDFLNAVPPDLRMRFVGQ